MAAFTGESFTSPFPTDGAQACAAETDTAPFPTDGAQSTAAQVFGGSSGAVDVFMKRARDSGFGGPGIFYVTWQVTDLTTAYPFAAPYGGPLVDTVHWQIG